MKYSPFTNKPLLSKEERAKQKLANIELIRKIITVVCPALDIKEEDLYSKSRKRELVEARGFLNLLLAGKKFTSEEMGKVLGRDHTTVLYSANEMASLIKTYPELKEKYELVVKCVHFSGILKDKNAHQK